jgi:hypothetical protein
MFSLRGTWGMEKYKRFIQVVGWWMEVGNHHHKQEEEKEELIIIIVQSFGWLEGA